MLSIDTVDEFTKLLLISGITFCLVGISIQFMRILDKMVGILDDLRVSTKNLGKLSTQFVEDYQFISKLIRSIANTLQNFNEKILVPVSKVSELFNRFGNRRQKQDSMKSEPTETE
jgi:hypothetical protein